MANKLNERFGQDGTNAIAHPKTKNRTDKPATYYLTVGENESVTNYDGFVMSNKQLTKSLSKNDFNQAAKTIKPEVIIAAAKEMVKRYGKDKYIHVWRDKYSYGPMTGKQHGREGVVDIWIPSIKAWKYGLELKNITEADIDESKYHSLGASNIDQRYQHVGGTLTVNGLIKLLQDKAKRFGDKAIRVFDDKTLRYFDIYDTNAVKGDIGLNLIIDTATPTPESMIFKKVDKQTNQQELNLDEFENSQLINGTGYKGTNSSTANSCAQDAVVSTISEKEDELDSKIEEAMKEIYK